MKRDLRVIELNKYECGAVFEALNEKRNALLDEGQHTDTVDDALLKVIDVMNKYEKGDRQRDEAR